MCCVSFSPKAKYIICGSEDQFVYIWKQHHDFYKFSSARRDRNDYWEAIKSKLNINKWPNLVLSSLSVSVNFSHFYQFSEFTGTNGTKVGKDVTLMILNIICDFCYIWKFKMNYAFWLAEISKQKISDDVSLKVFYTCWCDICLCL